MEQRSAELVLASLMILLDEPDTVKGAQDAVDGPLGKVQLAREFAHAEPA